MPTAAETQAFLDESKTPSVATPDVLLAGILAALPMVSNLGQQGSKLQQLVQMAQITEPDASLASAMEVLAQTYGAMVRQYNELQRFLNEAAITVKQWQTYDATVRAQAAAAGYTA